jgi:flavin-dependent dehydrogenase
MTTRLQPDVAIVGGGLAGAAAAIRLARAGQDVLVLERSERLRWTACGVFTAMPPRGWHELGLEPDRLAELVTPIPVFRLVSPGAAVVPLTYGAAAGEPAAHGLDRPRLDTALLDLAAAAGATVSRGSRVVDLKFAANAAVPTLVVRGPDGAAFEVRPRLVVGADGVRSTVATRLGLVRSPRIARRLALTFHVADNRAPGAAPRDGWMFVVHGGYCGLAPVPGGRVNVGIVLDVAVWGKSLRQEGAFETARRVLRRLPAQEGFDGLGLEEGLLDHVAGIVPVAHAVSQVSGDGWLLTGDAAGFVDPFTGEGIARALATAELAATAADDALRGDRLALHRYATEVRSRYLRRDRLSALVQGFLERPRLFDYAARRLATRPRQRHTLGLVLAERLPATAAFDPRFLGAVLRP